MLCPTRTVKEVEETGLKLCLPIVCRARVSLPSRNRRRYSPGSSRVVTLVQFQRRRDLHSSLHDLFSELIDIV